MDTPPSPWTVSPDREPAMPYATLRRISPPLHRTNSALAKITIAVLLAVLPVAVPAAERCPEHGLALQVLGSGGPEADDGRASTGYLLWREGKARILVDMGGGSMLRFEQSGARVADLDLILLTHLHVDHSADLPILVKGAFFADRSRDLPVYGPSGNDIMPATVTFLRVLFGTEDGAFRYLDRYLVGGGEYRLQPHDVDAGLRQPKTIFENDRYRISAVGVHHGPLPALAWRIDSDGWSVVISGDMNGSYHTLEGLADKADLLIAHHAIPEGTTGVARNLHMPPSVIGEIAGQAKVRKVVLSHRMQRTIGKERESEALIRKYYKGPLVFADDLHCFPADR
jgi:ribonuclease BN (tRNA processing enzyme)